MKIIPEELLMEVLQYCDIKTLSSLQCVDKYMWNMIKENRYKIIDKMNVAMGSNIPRNMMTYNAYQYIIDFEEIIIKKNKLEDDVIVEFEDIINFSLLFNMQKLSEQILRKYYKKISVNDVINNQTLPYDVLEQIITLNNFDATQWYILCKRQRFDVTLVEKYIEKVDWHALSQNKNVMSREFLERFSDKLFWIEVSNLGICEDLVLRYFDKINNRIAWNNITYVSKLSNDFISTYLHLFIQYECLLSLISCQSLSENIITHIIGIYEGNADILKKIASYQNLSKQFIINYKPFLPLRLLKKNQRIPRKLLHEVFG